MMMMMNCFFGMVNRWKAFNLISSRNYSQRSSPSGISDTPRVRFKLAQNLSSGLVEWSSARMITTTPGRHPWSNIGCFNTSINRVKFTFFVLQQRNFKLQKQLQQILDHFYDSHFVKYARMRVFAYPYFLEEGLNLRFCPYTAKHESAKTVFSYILRSVWNLLLQSISLIILIIIKS